MIQSLPLNSIKNEVHTQQSNNVQLTDNSLKELFSIVPGLFIFDFKGIIKYVSPTTADYTGYTSDDYVGNHLGLYIHHKDLPKALDTFDAVVNGNPAIDTSFRITKKEGGYVWWNTTSVADYKRKEVIALHTDLTEQKEFQTKLDNKDIALVEVMERLTEEKKKIEEKFATDIINQAMPIISQLKSSASKADLPRLQLLESIIYKTNGDFNVNMESYMHVLTLKEQEICIMLNQGLSTKEISNALDLSDATINTHRRNIRKKLGINKTNVSLTSFLRLAS